MFITGDGGCIGPSLLPRNKNKNNYLSNVNSTTIHVIDVTSIEGSAIILNSPGDSL